MTSNIVAYEWPLNGTTHVAYEAGDNHIHEMIIGREEIWRDADITQVAGGPKIEASILTGYSWPAGRTQQIASVSLMSLNHHIHEFVMLEDHPWSYADLMVQLPGAPAADGLALVGYASKTEGTKHVVYTGLDGHLHELSTGVVGRWHAADLTQLTGAPLPEGTALAAYAWQANKSRQMVYIGGDGHIHELAAGSAGIWSHTDMTDLTGAPLADGVTLVAFVWETAGSKQVIYTGNHGTMYELIAGADAAWQYTDVMSLTGAPLVDGSALAAYAWETGETKQVVYVGADHHVHEVVMDKSGRWVYTDLTERIGAPDASNDVIAGHEWSAQFAKHVVYLDTLANPHIHSLLLRHGSDWQYRDLTDLTGAQPLV